MKRLVQRSIFICLVSILGLFGVTRTIAQTPFLSSSPSALTLAYSEGNGPAFFNFSVNVFFASGAKSYTAVCSDPNYTFSSGDGQTDLGSTVEATNTFSFSPNLILKAGLSAGSYPTSVTISSPGLTPLIVTVTGIVANSNASIPNLIATPSALTVNPTSTTFLVTGSNMPSFSGYSVYVPSGVYASLDGISFSRNSIGFFGSRNVQQRIHLIGDGSAPNPATVRVLGGGANIASVSISPSSLTSTGCVNIASGFYPSDMRPDVANLQWTGLSSGGTYNLQWRPAGGNWTTVPSLTNNAYSLQGLTPGAVYEFKVSTVCSATATSDYGVPVSFTFTGACPTPIGLGTSGITSSSATLSWGTPAFWVPNNFNLKWRQQGSSTWNGPITGLTSRSYSLTNLNSNTGYEFQVEAVCSVTSTSGYTNPRSFSTTSCLNTATSLGSFGISTNSASLSWTAPGGGNSFSLQWKPVSSSNWAITSVSGLSALLSNLMPNTPYEWQIARACSTTDLSAYTGPKTFTTQASSITVLGGTSQQGCNEVASLSATGGFLPYTFIATGNSQSFSSSSGQFIGLPSGVYSVSAIDLNGSTGTSSFSIAPSLRPTISILPLNTTVCAGPPTSLTASGCSSGTLVWSTGQSSSVISVSTTSVGTTIYSATCLASGDCIALASTALTVVPSLPFAQISVSGQLGNSTTAVTITAQTSGATTYTFTGPAGFSENNVTGQVSVSQVGLYTITTVNTDGCLVAGTASALPTASPIVSNTFVVNNMLGCPQTGQTTATAGLAAVATGDAFVFNGPDGYVFSNVFRTPDTYNIVASGITQEGSYTLTVYNQGAITGSYSEGISSTCTSASAGSESKAKVSGGASLRVSLGGNLVSGDYVSFSVEGALGQPLRLETFNAERQLIDQQLINEAQTVEHQRLRLGNKQGSYYLKVSTPTGSKTVWLAR